MKLCILHTSLLLSMTSLGGCLVSDASVARGDAGTSDAASTVAGDDPSQNPGSADSPGIKYRDLATHPGCTTDGLTYPAAVIPGYKCAAKAYPVANEDATKPIVLLIHGNSSSPADYEKFPADKADAKPMLAERFSGAGYRVYAVDFRHDKSDDPAGNNDTENAAQNFDHAWAVPITQHFIDSVLNANPGRKIALVGFSVGPTIIRDALRRLHREKKKPYERITQLVYAAGGHHGVSTFRKLCGPNPTMRGKIACELGDRTAFQDTDISRPNNGPNGAWETPCLDGKTAYGQTGVCGDHKVRYLTIVMRDVKEGTYQDEFVSEGASALKGADNKTVELTDNDDTGYFFNGIFKNHYGALRSNAALDLITQAIAVP